MPLVGSTKALDPSQQSAALNIPLMAVPSRRHADPERIATAVVYCEANFGAIDGKTANGLVRHSEKYKILSVIDSQKAGRDSGEALGEKANGIPVCRDLADALSRADNTPDYFIIGMAPATGLLSESELDIVFDAIDLGMNIVNELHEFLNDDPVFAAASAVRNVKILDV